MSPDNPSGLVITKILLKTRIQRSLTELALSKAEWVLDDNTHLSFRQEGEILHQPDRRDNQRLGRCFLSGLVEGL